MPPVFESVGRTIVAEITAKNLTFERTLAVDLGQGGTETILIVGLKIKEITTGSMDCRDGAFRRSIAL